MYYSTRTRGDLDCKQFICACSVWSSSFPTSLEISPLLAKLYVYGTNWSLPNPPPVRLTLALADAALLCQEVLPAAGIAIELSFDSFRHASGLCTVFRADLASPGDFRLRLSPSMIAGMAIWSAKMGRSQFLTLYAARSLRRLQRYAITRAQTESLFGL